MQASVKVKDLFELYARARPLTLSTAHMYRTKLYRCLPGLLNRPIDLVSTAEIAEALEAWKHTPAQARVLSELLQTLVRFAMREGLAVGLKPDRVELRPVGVRLEHELITIENVTTWLLAVLGLDNLVARDLMLMMLLEGCRYSELASLEWKGVNLLTGHATIYDAVAKTHLRLPLSDYLTLLLRTRRERCTSCLVFGGIARPLRSVSKVVRASGVRFNISSLRPSFRALASSPEVRRLTGLDVAESEVFRHVARTEPETLRPLMQAVSAVVLEAAGLESPHIDRLKVEVTSLGG